MKLIGYVGKYGYDIVDENGNVLYWAGNSPFDSKQIVNPKYGLSQVELFDYCYSTLYMLADENNAKIIGVFPKKFQD